MLHAFFEIKTCDIIYKISFSHSFYKSYDVLFSIKPAGTVVWIFFQILITFISKPNDCTMNMSMVFRAQIDPLS